MITSILDHQDFLRLYLTKTCSGIRLLVGLGPWSLHGSFISRPVHCMICEIANSEGIHGALALAGTPSWHRSLDSSPVYCMIRRFVRGEVIRGSSALYNAGFITLWILEVYLGLQPAYETILSIRVRFRICDIVAKQDMIRPFNLSWELHLESSTLQVVQICAWWRYAREWPLPEASFPFLYIKWCEDFSLRRICSGLPLYLGFRHCHSHWTFTSVLFYCRMWEPEHTV